MAEPEKGKRGFDFWLQRVANIAQILSVVLFLWYNNSEHDAGKAIETHQAAVPPSDQETIRKLGDEYRRVMTTHDLLSIAFFVTLTVWFVTSVLIPFAMRRRYRKLLAKPDGVALSAERAAAIKLVGRMADVLRDHEPPTKFRVWVFLSGSGRLEKRPTMIRLAAVTIDVETKGGGTVAVDCTPIAHRRASEEEKHGDVFFVAEFEVGHDAIKHAWRDVWTTPPSVRLRVATVETDIGTFTSIDRHLIAIDRTGVAIKANATVAEKEELQRQNAELRAEVTRANALTQGIATELAEAKKAFAARPFASQPSDDNPYVTYMRSETADIISRWLKEARRVVHHGAVARPFVSWADDFESDVRRAVNGTGWSVIEAHLNNACKWRVDNGDRYSYLLEFDEPSAREIPEEGFLPSLLDPPPPPPLGAAW